MKDYGFKIGVCECETCRINSPTIPRARNCAEVAALLGVYELPKR